MVGVIGKLIISSMLIKSLKIFKDSLYFELMHLQLYGKISQFVFVSIQLYGRHNSLYWVNTVVW